LSIIMLTRLIAAPFTSVKLPSLPDEWLRESRQRFVGNSLSLPATHVRLGVGGRVDFMVDDLQFTYVNLEEASAAVGADWGKSGSG
jgi:hypothetical protein